jgi:hypothetical protein
MPTCATPTCSYETPFTTERYCVSCLSEAFDAVAEPDDVRGPLGLVEVTHAAIVFYTATVPTHEPTRRAGFLRLRAHGYRAGPAGDH